MIGWGGVFVGIVASCARPQPRSAVARPTTPDAGSTAHDAAPDPIAEVAKGLPRPTLGFVREVLAVQFEFAEGSADLDARAVRAIEVVSAMLRRESYRRVVIEGDADPLEGDDAARETLAMRRAEGVKAALVAQGVDTAILETASDAAYSPGWPIGGSGSRERAWHRRLRFRVFRWAI